MPVRELVLQGSAADCGANLRASLASYDRVTSSWKMSQLSLFGDSTRCSGIWPRSGLMRNGIAYPLATLAPLTVETESGSLPTPTADACVGSPPAPHMAERFRDRGSSGSFVEAVAARMWPTPTAGDANTAGVNQHTHTLGRQVRQEEGTGGLNPIWVEWLMGYPLGWTDCGRSATRLSRKSRSSSDAPS